MVAETQEEDVPIERRPILLAGDHKPLGRGHGMRPASRDEELMVKDPVVLVGDELVDDVLILGLGHHHQILERVVQIAAIVHVDVGRAAIPTFCRHVGHPLERHRHHRHLVRLDFDLQRLRDELEPLDDREAHRPNRQRHGGGTGRVKNAVFLKADPGVRHRRGRRTCHPTRSRGYGSQ